MAASRPYNPIFAKAKGYEMAEEQKDLKQFCKSSLPKLNEMKLELPHNVAKALSERVETSSLSPATDWKDIAAKLGCVDTERLQLIGCYAKNVNHLPFYAYILNEYKKSHNNFGVFVSSLLELQRYDLLTILRPYTEWRLQGNSSESFASVDTTKLKGEDLFNQNLDKKNALLKIMCDNSLLEKMRFGGEENGVTTNVFKYRECPSVESSSKNMHKDMNLKTTKNPRNLNSLSEKQHFHGHAEELATVNNSDSVKTDNKIMNISSEEDGTIISSEYDNEVTSSVNKYSLVSSKKDYMQIPEIFPSGNREESINVFITHSASDTDAAFELSKKIVQYCSQFQVVIQGDDIIDAVLMHNQSFGILQILKQADFVIPCISDEYLKDIGIQDPEEVDMDKQRVRLIFENYQKDYINAQCLNKSVVPVVLSNVPKLGVKEHLVFAVYYKQANISRIINVMKCLKSKRKISGI